MQDIGWSIGKFDPFDKINCGNGTELYQQEILDGANKMTTESKRKVPKPVFDDYDDPKEERPEFLPQSKSSTKCTQVIDKTATGSVSDMFIMTTMISQLSIVAAFRFRVWIVVKYASNDYATNESKMF